MKNNPLIEAMIARLPKPHPLIEALTRKGPRPSVTANTLTELTNLKGKKQ